MASRAKTVHQRAVSQHAEVDQHFSQFFLVEGDWKQPEDGCMVEALLHHEVTAEGDRLKHADKTLILQSTNANLDMSALLARVELKALY